MNEAGMLRAISDGLWEEFKKLGHKKQTCAAIAYTA